MPEQANPNVEGAIKERAALYLAVFRELTKRYGEDEAVDVLSTVSKTIGTAVGEKFPDDMDSAMAVTRPTATAAGSWAKTRSMRPVAGEEADVVGGLEYTPSGEEV